MNDLMNLYKNYFNFSGTLSRRGYWMALLEFIAVSAIMIFVAAFLGDNAAGNIVSIIALLFILGTIIPLLSAQYRRFKDAGYGTGWFIASLIIGIIGLVITLMPTKSKK